MKSVIINIACGCYWFACGVYDEAGIRGLMAFAAFTFFGLLVLWIAAVFAWWFICAIFATLTGSHVPEQ